MSPAAKILGAGFKIFVDQHTAIDRQSGLLGEVDARPHADSDHDEVGVDRNAVVEPNPSGFDGAHRVAEMEHDAMTLVQLPYEIAELRPQYALHRPRFGCHDMDLDLAMTQRGGRFESNEAGADHDGMSSPSGASNQVATVGERAQGAHMRQISPWHLQPDWFGASGEQELVKAQLFAAAEHDMAPGGIDRRRGCAEPQLDAVIGVKLGWA